MTRSFYVLGIAAMTLVALRLEAADALFSDDF